MIVDREEADKEEVREREEDKVDSETPGEEGAEKDDEERKEDVDLREGLTSSPDFFRITGGAGGWDGCSSRC